ncbi:hypothetical protein COX97_00910 [Candidatus Pacearchaeota archaeon CG_4_10_14_0_2_um_filter_05_32_18]|nr:MAG: hypothetical protein AUJ62_02245 [Candidatus Pacearchaeota archaeon CG1_02_32_21]PIZ83544.1 MAG: hypothetical protein COX97_00910 [Candidatus Pacearchaeota archaeon CG_4_10_14_0_2_um_filter_05_32_18]
MKKLFKFKYPKIFLLLVMIVLSYFIFRNPSISDYLSHLGGLGYLGIFIGGILFAFGFTAPFSVGLFISLNPSNIWIAGIIGGLGALISDLLIFKLIKFSFIDEFNRLRNTKTLKNIKRLIQKSIGEKIKVYLMYALAGILIASPLPDEAGVIMLAGLTKINFKVLAIISFILNTLGIILILSL